MSGRIKRKAEDELLTKVGEILALEEVRPGSVGETAAGKIMISKRREVSQLGFDGQAREAPASARGKFTGFKAMLAVLPCQDAPLIFDILYEGKIFLVAFGFAQATDGGFELSEMNAPLWKPLKDLVGERVLQPMFGSTVEEVHACLSMMKNYAPDTPFLVLCNNLRELEKVILSLHVPYMQDSRIQ